MLQRLISKFQYSSSHRLQLVFSFFCRLIALWRDCGYWNIFNQTILCLNSEENALFALECSLSLSKKIIIHAAYRKIFHSKTSTNPPWLEALLKIYKTHPNTSKNIAIALPHSLIKEKNINLAADLNSKEIQNFLYLQSEKQLGAPLAELAYDYQTNKTTDKTQQTTLKIIATPKKEVDYYRNLLSQNALNLAVLDVDILVLERGKDWLQKKPPLLNFKNKNDKKLFSKHATDSALCIGLALNKKR